MGAFEATGGDDGAVGGEIGVDEVESFSCWFKIEDIISLLEFSVGAKADAKELFKFSRKESGILFWTGKLTLLLFSCCWDELIIDSIVLITFVELGLELYWGTADD